MDGVGQPPTAYVFIINSLANIGAGERNRTPDPFITSEVLYRLSYSGNLIMWSQDYTRWTATI